MNASIKINIQNFTENIIVDDCDFICVDKIENLEKIIACSVVSFETIENQLKVKFEWKENAENLDETNFLFVSETNMIFFKSLYQWGAIEIKTKTLKRHENAFCFPSIENKKKFILIEDEFYAESCELNGDKIDNVPIDPPWEVKEFEDRIEYNSSVFGHQILKTKSMNKIYKISFNIYRIILISIIPIYFFSKFIVGMAGHNTEIKITDYLLLAFIILTVSLLNKANKVKFVLKNTLRYTLIGLVLISIGFLFYGLYDSWLLYRDQNFGIGDTLSVVIILLLIAVSSTLLVGIAKHKV